MEQYRLSYEIFPAIDGREISMETLNEIHKVGESFRKHYGRNMERGEAGAALSHLSLYKKIVSEQIRCAIIMEDDASFDERLKHFAESKEKLEQVFKEYDMVLLGYCRYDLLYQKKAVCSYWKRIRVDEIISVGRPVYWYWSAIGYLLTYEGAKKLLLQGEYPKMQADFLTANSPYYHVKLGIIEEPVIWPGFASEISTVRDKCEKLRTIETDGRKLNMEFLKEKLREIKVKLSLRVYPYLMDMDE